MHEKYSRDKTLLYLSLPGHVLISGDVAVLSNGQQHHAFRYETSHFTHRHLEGASVSAHTQIVQIHHNRRVNRHEKLVAAR